MIPGRVEAKLTVPSGTQVSASTAAHASPVTVTVPAGDYYLTAAGGVSGLLETLQDALNADATPSSGGWTVSLGDDGRVTIACSEPAAIAFTSTTLRDLLGFDADVDYPQTADQVAAAAGFGTWSSGYLCNEASGNLSAAFGLPSILTASGSPTYENPGPRGGADKAIGLENATDRFDGGDVWDVGANDDIAILWVGLFTSLPSEYGTIFSRVAASFTGGWALGHTNAPVLIFAAGASGANSSTLGTAGFHVGVPHVGCAVMDRSTGKIRVGTRSLADGTEVLGSEGAIAASFTVTSTFRVGASPWVPSSKVFQCAAFYVAHGEGAAAGMSSNLSTVLANFVAYMKGQTSTKAARGVWCPDAAMDVEGSDPRRAPRVTDLRTTTSPTGRVLGLVGPGYRRHKNVTWPLVPESRTWEAAAAVPNNTWETFFSDTQLGEHAWFSVSSPIQIYDHRGNRVGQDADVAGWQITGISSIDPRRHGNFTGLWNVTLPEIVASD